MPTVSVKPPNRQGAMLSMCAEPLATISPSMANLSSCSCGAGACSSALAATTAATAEAAEPPNPGPERNALLNVQFEAKIPAASAACMACTARPAVLCCRFHRQLSGDAGDRADAHHRFLDPPDAHVVADRIDRVAQNIEADADIGDGGGREGRDVGEHLILV